MNKGEKKYLKSEIDRVTDNIFRIHKDLGLWPGEEVD